MKFIVGLGNPGQKYLHTRHNIGFKVLDQLAGGQKWHQSQRGQLEYLWLEKDGAKIELIKPQTFMNQSGVALSYVKRKHPQLTGQNLMVIHDDLDLEVGQYKIQFGTGPQQHNGLSSIYEQLGTDQFWHVRIGIDGRHGDRSIPADEYVLSSFSPSEKQLVDSAIDKVLTKIFDLA